MEIKQVFGKHYKRLHTEGIIKSVIAGAVLSFCINVIFALLYWILELGGVWLGFIIGIPFGVAFGIILYFSKYRLTEKALACRIDRYGLEERMVTMVELGDDSSSIAKIQRDDAIKSLSVLSHKDIKFSIPTVLTVLTIVSLTLSISLTVLGVLAKYEKIPYGKDIFTQNADGVLDVVYQAGEGGKILGEKTQSVSAGGNTASVLAMADQGWMFIGWDDGEKYPERHENGVKSDMIITALFKKIDNTDSADDDSDSADDVPYGSVIEESGGGDSDQTGGETPKDDGEGNGSGKWQDRNQFIDGMTYYRDYLELYYKYSCGILDSDTEIPDEIIEFFEMYYSGI